MTSTTDGFVIAEADMQMRGPGDIEGTMQSGLPFDLHIANLAQDGRIIQMAREAAESCLMQILNFQKQKIYISPVLCRKLHTEKPTGAVFRRLRLEIYACLKQIPQTFGL